MGLKPNDSLLNGKYLIEGVLGRGGFGFVYLARDTLLGRPVAIKEMNPTLADDEQMVRRFLVEGRAALQVRHPNVVELFDVFSDRGVYYLAMEYCPGGSLEERLRSRFEWGLIVDIQPPDLETRIAILRSKADRAGRDVPQPILEMIAQAVQSNIRELEGSLTRVLAYADLSGLPLTMDLVKTALVDLLPQRRAVEPRRVVEMVANAFGLTSAELTGRGRTREVALPRQVAMYLLREEGNVSLPQIGEMLGGRDHTTVMYACDKVADMMERDDRLRRQVVDGTARARPAGRTREARVQALAEAVVGRGVLHDQRLGTKTPALADVAKDHRLRAVRTGCGQAIHGTGDLHVLRGQGRDSETTAAGAIRGKVDGRRAALVTRRRSVDGYRDRAAVGALRRQQAERTAVGHDATGGAIGDRVQRLRQSVVRHVVGDRHCLRGHRITLAVVADVEALAGRQKVLQRCLRVSGSQGSLAGCLRRCPEGTVTAQPDQVERRREVLLQQRYGERKHLHTHLQDHCDAQNREQTWLECAGLATGQ